MSSSITARFVSIFSSRVVEFVALLIATPVIVRILGPAEFGKYAFLLSVLGVLMLFVDGGIFDGIRKFMTENGRPEGWQSQVFGFYARVATVLVVVLGGSLFAVAASGVPSHYFGDGFDRYFAVLGLLIVVRQFGAVVRGGLMGLDRERVSESLQILNKLLFVTVGVVLLLSGYGIVGLLGARILGHFAMVVGGGIVLAGHVDLTWLVRRVGASFPSRELLAFNVGSLLLFGFYVSILHLDVLLIQWYRGSEATGIYRAALTVAEFLWFVPRIAQMTLVHSTSRLWSEGEREKITSISSQTTRYTLCFTLLLAIGLAALAGPFVTTYYGTDFAAAVGPLLILIPGAIAFAVARPVLAIGQGNGDLRHLTYATGAAAAINVLGNVLLIPRFGLTGAAVATTTSYCSMLVFHLWSARLIGFDPLADLRLPRVALTAALSAVPIFALARVIEGDLLALAIVPPVGFVVYATLSLASGVVEPEDLSEIPLSIR